MRGTTKKFPRYRRHGVRHLEDSCHDELCEVPGTIHINLGHLDLTDMGAVLSPWMMNGDGSKVRKGLGGQEAETFPFCIGDKLSVLVIFILRGRSELNRVAKISRALRIKLQLRRILFVVELATLLCSNLPVVWIVPIISDVLLIFIMDVFSLPDLESLFQLLIVVEQLADDEGTGLLGRLLAALDLNLDRSWKRRPVSVLSEIVKYNQILNIFGFGNVY